MSKDNFAGNLLIERLAIATGSTATGATAVAGQVFAYGRIFSGGSLEIGGSYVLSSGASTAFASGNGYLVGAAEVINFPAVGTMWMISTGSTCVLQIVRGLSPGV